MGDVNLREFDAWIAEHVFGHQLKYIDAPISQNVYVFYLVRKPASEENEWTEEEDWWEVPFYSAQPVDFALIKRGIEKRWWGWDVSRENGPKASFRFTVHVPQGMPGQYCREFKGYANTEELAGCLALKEAVKATEKAAEVTDG